MCPHGLKYTSPILSLFLVCSPCFLEKRTHADSPMGRDSLWLTTVASHCMQRNGVTSTNIFRFIVQPVKLQARAAAKAKHPNFGRSIHMG